MAKITEIYNFLSISHILSTSGQPTELQLQALADEGYEVIINLALHDDPRYSLQDQTRVVEDLGMKYIHIPVQFDAPTKNDLSTFFDAMEANAEKKIHIHCAANMRVTAFLGLYLLVKKGVPKEQAFAPMQSIWKPNETWSSFIAMVAANN